MRGLLGVELNGAGAECLPEALLAQFAGIDGGTWEAILSNLVEVEVLSCWSAAGRGFVHGLTNTRKLL